jgi:predicted CXXCH cytochrome family protein
MKYPQLKIQLAFLSLIFSFFLIDANAAKPLPLQDALKDDQCITCHVELELLPDGYREFDIHMQKGLSCAGCHGGDPTSDDEDMAMSEENNFVGVPSHEEIPEFCGKCHSDPIFMRRFHPGLATDQVSQFYTSVHGQKIIKGDNKVAVCNNCHTSHGILPSKDPRSSVYPLNVPQTCRRCHSNAVYMKSYKIATNQYELYAESVHGNALIYNKDIGAPACNDCHGNHGATPPGLTSVTFICGSCHVKNMEFFRQTRMSSAFEEHGFHGCEQCHGYHAVQKTGDKLVGIEKESFCVKCHEDGDTGFEAAKKIKINLSELVALHDSAGSLLRDVSIKGMNDIDIGFLLQEGRQKLIESRTLVHTFDLEKVIEKSKEGNKVIKEAINLAEEELDEYHSRRIGFAIATGVFVIFAVALFLVIKDIEKKDAKKSV